MPKNSTENANPTETPAVKNFLKNRMGAIQDGAKAKTDTTEKLESLHKGINYLNGAADFASELGLPEEELTVFDAGINVLSKQVETIEAELAMEKLLG